jgi:hypothetical protein
MSLIKEPSGRSLFADDTINKTVFIEDMNKDVISSIK